MAVVMRLSPRVVDVSSSSESDVVSHTEFICRAPHIGATAHLLLPLDWCVVVAVEGVMLRRRQTAR